jgi:hypothetical protein
MRADRQNQSVHEAGGLAHDIDVAVRNGIERAGEKRGARHEWGLACALPGRKAAATTAR